MQSKILKSEEEFEQLKNMLIQDAEISNMEVYFCEDEPEDYPCLCKIEEINNQSMNIEMDEDADIEEMMENAEFSEGYIYDFLFISQKEIKELLEV